MYEVVRYQPSDGGRQRFLIVHGTRSGKDQKFVYAECAHETAAQTMVGQLNGTPIERPQAVAS